MTRKLPSRDDWEDVKVDIMRRSVELKFQTHENLRQLLLSTGRAEIVENAPIDGFWGCGPDGKGLNMLGKILMDTRKNLITA